VLLLEPYFSLFSVSLVSLRVERGAWRENVRAGYSSHLGRAQGRPGHSSRLPAELRESLSAMAFAFKPTMGALAVIIMLIAYAIYIWQTTRAKGVQPHPFSWFLWGIVTGVAYLVQARLGGGPGSLGCRAYSAHLPSYWRRLMASRFCRRVRREVPDLRGAGYWGLQFSAPSQGT
jgi:hypothetical protein